MLKKIPLCLSFSSSLPKSYASSSSLTTYVAFLIPQTLNFSHFPYMHVSHSINPYVSSFSLSYPNHTTSLTHQLFHGFITLKPYGSPSFVSRFVEMVLQCIVNCLPISKNIHYFHLSETLLYELSSWLIVVI